MSDGLRDDGANFTAARRAHRSHPRRVAFDPSAIAVLKGTDLTGPLRAAAGACLTVRAREPAPEPAPPPVDALRRACDVRGINGGASTRAVVYAAKPRRTAALVTILAAVRWREATKLPAGDRQGALVVLAGGAGCGKTCAASWLVARLPSARAVDADTVGNVAPNDWSDNLAELEALESVAFLFIDECGMELNPKAAERVLRLIVRRYNEGRITVVATNLNAADFTARYFKPNGPTPDARLISRFVREQEKGGLRPGLPYWYDLPDVDLRGVC